MLYEGKRIDNGKIIEGYLFMTSVANTPFIITSSSSYYDKNKVRKVANMEYHEVDRDTIWLIANFAEIAI